MSSKNATEDFYFLQKIAKYTRLDIIDEILVYPSSRAEQRIYLGTGYRMKNIINNISFNEIKISKRAIYSLRLLYQIIDQYIDKPTYVIEKRINEQDHELWNFLNQNNILDVIHKIQKSSKC